MKKILFLGFICSMFCTVAWAQPAASAAPTAEQRPTPEMIKKQMIEKTGITEAQADKVIEINMAIRNQAKELRDLPEAERTAKIAELKDSREKKYAEVLTPEQVKALHAFYEEMGKNKEQKTAN